ncbi:hypothetical protein Plec18167_006453 [Paecilomyces lecythidis]|uniref:Uncharacterized protein n=1 Tax=Paecilomyces lecythidis TaxID=3004212 RepID=A0ABR3XCJ0_9EURO
MDFPDDQLHLSDFPLWDPLAPQHFPSSENTFEEFNERWPSLGDEWCFQTYFPEFATEPWTNKNDTVNKSCSDTIVNGETVENRNSLSLGLGDQVDGKLKLTEVRDTIRRTVEQCFSVSSFSSVNTPEGRESPGPRKRRRMNSQELSVDSPLSYTTSSTEPSATSQSAATPIFSPDEPPFCSLSQGYGDGMDLQTDFDDSVPINWDIVDVNSGFAQWDWSHQSPQSHPQQTCKSPDSDGLTPLEMPDGTIRFTTNWLPASSEDCSTYGTSDSDIWPPMNAT